GSGAHHADRPYRRASSIDGWLGLERHRHRVVRLGRRWSLVGDLDLGSRRDRVCRRLHAGPESSRRQTSCWRLVSQHHPLYWQLLDRRRSLVSRVTTRCGRCWPARGVLCHERWSVHHGWRVPLARAMQTGACTRTPPFRPVLRNRAALGYILGYGAHCFELYGMRTSIVAFWTFVGAQNRDRAFAGPFTVSVIVTLPAFASCLLRSTAASGFGPHAAIAAVR